MSGPDRILLASISADFADYFVRRSVPHPGEARMSFAVANSSANRLASGRRCIVASRVRGANFVSSPLRISLILLLLSCVAVGQRYPTILIPNSPRGIFTIMQDSKSRLWLGTIDDVYCFDGGHFYSLRPYGFPKEIPNGFAEDGDGGIWIATQGTDVEGGTGRGGLYRYHPGKVDKMFSGDGLSVVQVAPDTIVASVGTEAVGRPTYGDLYRFQKRGDGWVTDRLLEKRAHHLSVDASGTALFSCPGGWCELSLQGVVSFNPAAPSLPLVEHAGDPMVEKIVRDRFGCLWYRAELTASYQCPDSPSIVRLPDDFMRDDSSAHLEETSDGSIFMLVSMFLGRPGNFHIARTRNGLPNGMDTATVAKDGTIWIGTDHGLYRFPHPFQIEYWNQDNGVETPYSVLRVGKQVFVTSTGITELNPDRRSWSVLPGTEVLAGTNRLIPGPDGTIYAGSSHGVSQLSYAGKFVARTGFADMATILERTKDGQLWMGSSVSRIGVNRIFREGSRLLIKRDDGVPTDFSSDLSYDAEHDMLWACDGKDVFFRMHGEWNKITQQDGLLDMNCRSIAAHPNGDVWIGYENSQFGVIRNAAAPQRSITNFSASEEKLVANSATTFVAVDRHGWVWRGGEEDYLATPQDAVENQWLELRPEDGMPLRGVNTHAFFVDPDGSAWFGSDATVIHFTPPADFLTNFPPPSFFISGFSASGHEPVLAENLKEFPHGSQIVAHIGSLLFDRRGAMRLRYRVLPEQSSWTTTSDFDLPLGKFGSGGHTLEVQAKMWSGPWTPTSTQTFNVLRPLWLSWPVLGGVLAAGGLSFAGVRRWRKKRSQRESKKLPSLGEWRLAALSPELQSLSGATLDSRFRVGNVLARGGFATIAEGNDLQQQGRPCAIKIFRHELTDREWMTKRFQQEVMALEKIHHPNVIRIYGHGTTPAGSKYLAMEFVQGQTLREMLEKGRLTPQQTASYLSQTGDALEEIHRHGICHRDLKPENLMIRDKAADHRDLVLIDFSIAIVQDPDETLHGLSRAAGTLYYMAPEQSIGYADPSTDIYSLAKIVIEMLTGQRLSTLLPDAAMDLPERVRELLQGLNIGLSSASIELMSSALQFDPSRRPKGARLFAEQVAANLAAPSHKV
jgi:tRNA A-37 threonylcarbamoyl transferase component Bud32